MDDPPAPSRSGGDTAPPAERTPGKRRRAAYLLGPIVLTLLLGGLVRAWTVRETANELLAAGVASVLGLGTSVILAPAVLERVAFKNVTSWDLAWLVIYLNAATAFLFAFNLDLLERLPWIGPRMKRKRHAAATTLRDRPWVRRWATAGVGVFVLLPVPGSSSFMGCVIGRLMGLSNLATFLSVTVAGTVVSLLYGWGSTGLRTWLAAHEVGTGWRIAGALVVLAIVVVALRAINHRNSRVPSSESSRA